MQLREVVPCTPLLAVFCLAASVSLTSGYFLGAYGQRPSYSAHLAQLGVSAVLAVTILIAIALLESARVRRALSVLRGPQAFGGVAAADAVAKKEG